MDSLLVRICARIVIYAFVVAAAAGCKGASTTPSASPTASAVPRNPSSTTITVENSQSKPLELATVVLSSSVDVNNIPNGTIYGSQMTGSNGVVAFHDLPSTGQVCATASERFYTTVAVCKDPFDDTLTIVLP
jgi:hypothetical protein